LLGAKENTCQINVWNIIELCHILFAYFINKKFFILVYMFCYVLWHILAILVSKQISIFCGFTIVKCFEIPYFHLITTERNILLLIVFKQTSVVLLWVIFIYKLLIHIFLINIAWFDLLFSTFRFIVFHLNRFCTLNLTRGE
jgi:hypothetical protein